MAVRIFIENPPPFRQAPRGTCGQLVDVPIEEGVETARFYLNREISVAGFHHSDLDPYESRQMRAGKHLERYPSFEYSAIARKTLSDFEGILIPHKVVVYSSPQSQGKAFRQLTESGIRDVVLVGRPYTIHPHGITYHTTVTDMLRFLKNLSSEIDLNLGVIGIHSRNSEAERIADKYVAAGGQLQIMGQFLDEVDGFIRFLEELAAVFSQRSLSLDKLKWNVGLAIYALKNRTFYNQLLRKDELACEYRFKHLTTVEDRILESVQMNLEFAEKAKDKADHLGIDLGFSLQSIMERNTDGTAHPSVYGIALLGEKLTRRFG